MNKKLYVVHCLWYQNGQWHANVTYHHVYEKQEDAIAQAAQLGLELSEEEVAMKMMFIVTTVEIPE